MEPTSSSNPSATVAETFPIAGMTCGHCVAAVRDELTSIDGVTSVDVDLESGSATVTSATPIDRALVVAAVDEAGYEVVT